MTDAPRDTEPPVQVAEAELAPEVEKDPQGQLVEILSELDRNRDEPVQRGELRRVVSAMQVQVRRHSGPLPSPEAMDHYDKLIPNGADRIMSMAEKEQAHRHRMEEREQALIEQAEEHDFTITKRGQVFGLSVCIAVVLAAVALAVTGHPGVAAVLVGLDLVALAAVFVAGRYLPGRARPSDAGVEDTADAEEERPAVDE